MDLRHADFRTNDYPFPFVWVFVMHISVRMTSHIHMGFRHAHFCTYDYPYCFCIGFRHAHFCTNDYPFLCVWVYVMYNSVRMTVHIICILVLS